MKLLTMCSGFDVDKLGRLVYAASNKDLSNILNEAGSCSVDYLY